MSESLAKERPSIELNDFDRRYHQQPASHQNNDDPLAELARLVGEHHDPYGDVFAHEAAAGHEPGHAAHHGYDPSGRREPAFGAPTESPRLAGDFAAIEAGLRGAFAAHPETAAPTTAAEHEFYAQHEGYPHGDAYPAGEAPYPHDYAPEQFAAAPHLGVAPSLMGRVRRPAYTVAATIAVGVIGVGIAFAFKGTSSSPSAIRTIAAASGPTKIQPPADAAGDQAGQDSAMLGKKGADAPTQLVSREEQPVDLSQAVQENASRNADAGSAAPGDASNVPVPPSPSQAAQGTETMGFGAGMPAPKRVKVVSVRPDGTILPNDAAPQAALPAQRQVASAESQDPIARASTPSDTPKATTRIGAAPKRPAQDADDQAAAQLTRKSRQKLASVEPTDDASAEHSGGGFAVQLAAPGTEADAKSASSRLSKKFSAALSGHRLGFHKAQSNGKSVYRIRVSKLSKGDATSLCEKLKADGGSCFVAKN